MIVFGSDCAITLFRNNTYTPIPYTFETLREKREEKPLEPLLGQPEPLQTIPVGTGGIEVLGCLGTRICKNSLPTLASIMVQGPQEPLTICKNRIVEKRIYHDCTLLSWTLRGERDKAIYGTYTITGNDAAEWDHTIPELPWEETETLTFEDGNLAFEGNATDAVYKFILERNYNDAITTYLQIHYPLQDGAYFLSKTTFDRVSLTFANIFRISLDDVRLQSFYGESDSPGEVLAYRKFAVYGPMVIELRNNVGVWEEVS